MGFKSIKINNFRQIRQLALEDIKQVNLITGKNNCGKSTILEALFLSVGISNPQLAINIHNFRNLILTDDDDFRFLFHNLSTQNTPSIASYINRKGRKLVIKPLFRDTYIPLGDEKKDKKFDNNFKQDVTMDSSSSSIESNEIIGIDFSFEVDKKNYDTQLSINRAQIMLNKNYVESIHGSFLTPSTIMQNLQNRLDKLIVNKEVNKIVSVLREIEPNLNDIKMGANGNIYADIGNDKLIPINLMGDGIRRVLSILAYIYERKHSIIFIDEIENGLHYSTLSVLWKAIARAVKDNDVQLFASTHSFDCIKSFANTFENERNSELLKIERLEKEHIVKRLDMESLGIAVEKSFETR